MSTAAREQRLQRQNKCPKWWKSRRMPPTLQLGQCQWQQCNKRRGATHDDNEEFKK